MIAKCLVKSHSRVGSQQKGVIRLFSDYQKQGMTFEESLQYDR